jgi:hypothetical protein
MPTPTYTPLANVTLGSSAASVTFSSIPATYRDLIVVLNGKTLADSLLIIAFNGDTTASNYNRVDMRGDSGGAISVTGNDRYIANFASTDSSTVRLDIMDYSATDKHKTLLSRNTELGSRVRYWANRWANTAAITSVAVGPDGGSFASGTTVNLYGVIA